jgi:hypothetical protein
VARVGVVRLVQEVGVKARGIAAIELDDERGHDWHRRATAAWEKALDAAGGDSREALASAEMPPLPDFGADAPAHVQREILGRFLQDRDSRTVHDVYRATPECGVDAIRNGTFFHFWSEVLADTGVADDLPCPRCIAP